jgi:poly(3-hydroxybutyrate) depolymerase
VYLPSAALAGKPCGVHVALHGCKQSRELIGNIFANSAGYNEWAEANDLIVLYPQATATSSMGLFNPLGSWDWWGYTGQDYAMRSGRQMKAISEMVNCLTDQVNASCK